MTTPFTAGRKVRASELNERIGLGTTWVPLTPASGFSPTGLGGGLAYRLAGNTVHLRMNATCPVPYAANTPVTVLPSAVRPAEDVFAHGVLSGGTVTSWQITPTGNVMVIVGHSAGTVFGYASYVLG